MEMNTEPTKLTAQEKKPGLVPFMRKAVEENIDRQLDKAWKKDESAGDISGAEREPTEVVKESAATFYADAGLALAMKKIAKKISE